MSDPVAYLMENDESMWLGFGPDHRAATAVPLYKEKWKVGVPDGWKLVPIEPTAEMCRAFYEASPSGFGLGHASYKAMLNAAPEYKGEK